MPKMDKKQKLIRTFAFSLLLIPFLLFSETIKDIKYNSIVDSALQIVIILFSCFLYISTVVFPFAIFELIKDVLFKYFDKKNYVEINNNGNYIIIVAVIVELFLSITNHKLSLVFSLICSSIFNDWQLGLPI